MENFHWLRNKQREITCVCIFFFSGKYKRAILIPGNQDLLSAGGGLNPGKGVILVKPEFISERVKEDYNWGSEKV